MRFVGHERRTDGAKPLVVQTGLDEYVIERPWLALQRPEDATLDEARRDSVELGPPRKAAVGLSDSLQQIGHGSSVRSCSQPWTSKRSTCNSAPWGYNRPSSKACTEVKLPGALVASAGG